MIEKMIDFEERKRRKEMEEAVNICLKHSGKLALRYEKEYGCFIKPHGEKKACRYQGVLFHGEYLCNHLRK